jgi:hypothetical protein
MELELTVEEGPSPHRGPEKSNVDLSARHDRPDGIVA